MAKTIAMETKNFSFRIEAEPNNSVIVKVLTAIIRRRMPLISLRCYGAVENGLQIDFIICATDVEALNFSRQLEKQIDILSVEFSEKQTVEFSEKQNQSACKTELLRSFSIL